MDVDQVMVGAGSGPPWVPGHSAAVRYGDGCLNGTFLTSTTQQQATYDVISFNYGVHDVCYSGYLEEWVPLPLYEASIRAIKRTLQATGAKVVFQASTPVEYNLTTNARILAYNAAAKAVMAEAPVAAYSDLYAAVVAVCGNPPYNAPDIPNSPNCSISDYNGVHYHEGGWELLAKTASASIKALLAGTMPRHVVKSPLARAGKHRLQRQRSLRRRSEGRRDDGARGRRSVARARIRRPRDVHFSAAVLRRALQPVRRRAEYCQRG